MARSADFPGYPETRAIRTLKSRADRLYEEGRYQRAHRLFSTRLALFGDKYSQYMTGFQYLHGQGVPRDPGRALAWYRLAAERGQPDLVLAHDELAKQLSADQQRAAEGYFRAIEAIYGDQRVLERLIFKDRRELRTMTGSRLGATIGPLKTLRSGGTAVSGSHNYEQVAQRMAARIRTLQLLRGRVEYGDLSVLEPDEEQDQEPGEPESDSGGPESRP